MGKEQQQAVRPGPSDFGAPGLGGQHVDHVAGDRRDWLALEEWASLAQQERDDETEAQIDAMARASLGDVRLADRLRGCAATGAWVDVATCAGARLAGPVSGAWSDGLLLDDSRGPVVVLASAIESVRMMPAEAVPPSRTDRGWRGLVRDHSDSRVSVVTVSGRRQTGTLVEVARDHLALRENNGPTHELFPVAVLALIWLSPDS